MAKQTFTTGQVLTASQMSSLQETAMLGGSASAKTASHTLVAADAGTFISMSSTSATTITVNTGLFASGDIVTILNVNSGACTITAGSATVAKPANATLALVQNAGGVLYFTATGAATFMPFDTGSGSSPLTTKGDLYGFSTLDARVPIGANNTILTADSTQSLGLKWAAPSVTFSGASVFNTTDYTIATGAYADLTFNSEAFDTDAFHSTSVNTARMTIPVGKAGKYLLIGQAYFAANATGVRNLRFFKNNTTSLGYVQSPSQSATNATGITISRVVDLAVTDYVTFQVFQNSGGNLTVFQDNTYFDIAYLGA